MRSLTLLGSLCGLLAMNAPSQGAVILTFNDLVGDPVSVTVDPSNPSSLCFTFNVSMNSTEAITGVTYLLETPSPATQDGSGKFSIFNRNTTGAAFSGPMLTTANATVLSPANALLDPRNNNDLGGTVLDPLNESISPGANVLISQITLCADPSILPGSYIICTYLPSATADLAGGFDEIPIARAIYTVNVVPEPVSAWLLCLGGALLGGRCGKRTKPGK